MFEISGQDILDLNDADLRSLVKGLALAEIRSRGGALSAVTAGGNQDAADGGLDIRVECLSDLPNPDFVPRRVTGFQVKKSDMPANAILAEVRPRGTLRDVIHELADASGAYILVSAQGSLADKPLADRRKALRDALEDLPRADQLHTDFYDRERISIWANKYPGIVAWIRGRLGRSLSGWSIVNDWDGNGGCNGSPYLLNDKACLIDESTRQHEHLTIVDGITRLRGMLRNPARPVRLVGLSGLGKTRLVQALFEQGVAADALDPSISVYTDYSEETNPTARDMARDLVARGERAILIVDNCNPRTHSELAQLCAVNTSKVSLLTVEYDVRDDEPERTDVFRLQAASPDLVKEWLQQDFTDVSQLDRDKIADFSGGNFRVARALAETIGRSETLGSLKSRGLFERIFHQRNELSQQLLHEAEELSLLSLLYSIDGQDTSSSGELNHLTIFRDIDAKALYTALVELRKRGVVQTRGRFRAILPQAIANPLAARALERIPPDEFDRFCSVLPTRMIKSVSRRLGYLHDSIDAQEVAKRWLVASGPLENLLGKDELGLQILANIAPVNPQGVLNLLHAELDSPNATRILAADNRLRHYWIRLIKVLGYEAPMFDVAATLLARFLAAEQEGDKCQSASEAFSDLFHIYLSGTHAIPEQRRVIVKRLAISENPNFRRCASLAISALLKTDNFMSMSAFDFGARSRDWGWQPKINKDIWDWYAEAIALTVELESYLPDARSILARHAGSLWYCDYCRDSLEHAAGAFVQTKPWIEGWIAFRTALRLDGKKMTQEERTRVEQVIVRLKPLDLLNQARAVILNLTHGDDFADGEEDQVDGVDAWEKAFKKARRIGRLLAHDDDTRKEFLSELVKNSDASRAFDCGRGLADGTDNLDSMWNELTSVYSLAEGKSRDVAVLGGFLREAYDRDKVFSSSVLEAAIDNPMLAPRLPYFQKQLGLDEEGILRLLRAIKKGVLVSTDFWAVAGSVVWTAALPPSLATLLEDIAALPNGIDVTLQFLHTQFDRDRHDNRTSDLQLVAIGRELLTRANFSRKGPLRDYGAYLVIRICLAGEEGREAARLVCANLRSAIEDSSLHDLNGTFKALFKTQPLIALDIFVLPESSRRIQRFFRMDFSAGSSIEVIPPDILRQWADLDADIRYPALGQCLRMFVRKLNEDTGEISPLFLSILDFAPDKRKFLGGFWDRMHPQGWSGSLATILLFRKEQVAKLAEGDEEIQAWLAEISPELDSWVEDSRKRESDREESFE